LQEENNKAKLGLARDPKMTYWGSEIERQKKVGKKKIVGGKRTEKKDGVVIGGGPI